MAPMGVRIDKWLHVARAFKTRTVATKACELSRVRLNGVAVKAHRLVAIGDRIEVEVGDWTRILVVRELAEKPLPKAEVPRLFEDLSPPRPARDDFERLLARPIVRRGKGEGRPTKKDRREIDAWLDDRLDGRPNE